MPTGLPLDFDALLAPLGDSEPAGSSAAYFELRSQLEDLRKEVNPEDFDADDLTRPTEPKRADWYRIEELTRTTLAESSKDLRLAGYLVEALVHRYGFAGLRDGLRLLREMIEQCWDRMYPSIEDGDLEVRTGPFNALDDLNTRGRTPFPQVLRTFPILGPGPGKYGFQEWRTAQEAGQEEMADAIAQAIQATPPDRATEQAKNLEECTSEIQLLAKALEAKIGPDVTHLPNLRAAIQDCQRVVRLVERKSEEERPPEEGQSDIVEDGQPSATPRRGGDPTQMRNDAYRKLREAADLLKSLEPHSPIPYLVHRAIELGALPFPQLMRALIRNADVLTELNREMGIKSEETT